MKPFIILLMGVSLLFLGLALSQETDAAREAAALETRLQRIFDSVPTFEPLEVTLNEGIVTLSGSTSNEVRDDAIALLEKIDGVLYIVDTTEQETGVNENLSPALLRLRSYWKNAVALVPLLGVALLTLALFWILSRLLGRWKAPYARLGINPLLRTFVSQLVRLGIMLIGVLIALDIVGATSFVAAILGTAGVAGLAVGFAFRDIVENYLAGVLMSVRQPFAQGDFISVAGHSGVIVRLTARELVLMTADGNHVRVPNATVFKSDIVNYTRNPRRRFDFKVGVDVDEDLVHVQSLGLDTLKMVNGIMLEPAPFGLIESLGDFNVIVRFYAWVDQRNADFGKVKSQAIRLVKEAFDEAGVLMPEPITNVRVQEVPRTARLGDAPPPVQTVPLDEPESLESVNEALDVSVEDPLKEQLEEEYAMSDETNLLDANAPKKPKP